MGRLSRDRLSRRIRGVHPEPRLAPARSLFSRAARRLFSAAARRLRHRRRDRDRDAVTVSISMRCRCVSIPRLRAWRSWRRRRRPSFVAFDLLAVDGRDLRTQPQRERRALPRAAARRRQAADVPDADDARSRAVASDWLTRFEGAGLDGVIVKPAARDVRARQARDDQGEARPNRRLRRGGLSLAQDGKEHARRIAAARARTMTRARCSTSA